MNGKVRAALEERNYRAVDKVFQLLVGLIDCETGYVKCPKKSKMHAVGISLLSRVISGNLKRG